MKKILLSALAICTTYITMGQLMIGPEAGVNIANYSQKYGTASLTTQYLTGLRAGIVADIPVAKGCYIQTALFYMRNGTSFDVHDYFNNNYTLKLKVNTIELPINFVYKLGKPSHGKAFAGVGMYVAGNISGSITSSLAAPNHRDIQIGPDVHDDLKIIDLGINVNAGYQLKNGLFLKAAFQTGFVNLNPRTPLGDVTVKSKTFGITVGYLTGRTSFKNKTKEANVRPKKRAVRHAINTED